MNDRSGHRKGSLFGGWNCMRIAPRRNLSHGRAASLVSDDGSSSLRQSDPRLDSQTTVAPFPTPTGKTAVVGWVLLVYAVLLFVHFYRSSGGASSVGIVEGQFVYMYKSAVIRPISEEEYNMFPTQVARIMSAWIGMMATFCLSSLINQAKTGVHRGGPELTAMSV
jgi:hypothetical protein